MKLKPGKSIILRGQKLTIKGLIETFCNERKRTSIEFTNGMVIPCSWLSQELKNNELTKEPK